ncbi:MAG: beta-galactosidase [Acidimicrobiales bacterium]
MTAPEPYLLSGEFHYFRLPREVWTDRLRQVAEAGLTTVSIYVPWNWHQASEDRLDLTGTSNPDHDLRAVLGEIGEAGLSCVFRPGPFVTAEWRQGGIPDWFLERNPSAAALDSSGSPAGNGRLYPAITYAHPAYRAAARAWLEPVFELAGDYLASRGGPIVNVQLDDEPSYWQRLFDPLGVDYNPCLVEASDGPSRYAAWLLARYGSLDSLNGAYGTSWSKPGDIVPPRERAGSVQGLPRFIDWLDFKFAEINDYISYLCDVTTGAGVDVQLSILHPYLLPLGTLRCREYVKEHELPLQLTNECYLTLFSGGSGSENKLGAVLACHEIYRMWALPETGPLVTMELQSSNSSYITPGAMELLYALTVARGIRGVNYFMMVGGQNPLGYENETGAEYDISAPISPDGLCRPHYEVIAKLSQMVHGWIDERLADAVPLRDVWIGCYQPYEAMLLSVHESMFGLDGFAEAFNSGDIGLSEANSLVALFGVNSVSFGCADLETVTAEELAAVEQLWLPGGPFLSRAVQEKLAAYVQSGGDLVVLPALPGLDEQMRPCTVLSDLALGTGRQIGDPSTAEGSLLYGTGGETMVTSGSLRRWEVDKGCTELVHNKEGAVCGFSRPIGRGKMTVLGFHLKYTPTAGSGQHAFLRSLLRGEKDRQLSAWASVPPCAAFQLQGTAASLLCLANPVELSLAPKAFYSRPGEPERCQMPLILEGVPLRGRGARLLPIDVALDKGVVLRHATWELIGLDSGSGSLRLTFVAPGGHRDLGEIALQRAGTVPEVRGGRIVDHQERHGLDVFVVEAHGTEIEVIIPTGASDRT